MRRNTHCEDYDALCEALFGFFFFGFRFLITGIKLLMNDGLLSSVCRVMLCKVLRRQCTRTTVAGDAEDADYPMSTKDESHSDDEVGDAQAPCLR